MNATKVLRIASLVKNRLNTSIGNALLEITPIDIMSDKLIELLESEFGFSYKLVSPCDGKFGRLLPDGKWTGMVGMIYRGDADIIIDALSVTESRNEVIDFSQPFFIDRWTFATKIMTNSHNETDFLNPFTFHVWLAIVISFSIISLTDKVLYRICNSKNDIRMHNISSKPSKNFKDKTGMYFLKSGSMIAGAFFRFFYTSVLLSFLVILSLSDIRTMPDLAKAVNEDKYRCAAFDTYYIPQTTAKSQDPNIKILSQCISEYKGLPSIHYELSHKKSNSNIAIFGTESYLKLFKNIYFVSEDIIFLDLISIGVRKNFCCKKQLNSILNKLLSSGILNKFIEYDYFHKIITPILNAHSENAYVSLSLKDFKGLFALVFIGYSFSMLILFMEILVHRFYKNKVSNNC